MAFASIKQKINVKYFMVAYLGLLFSGAAIFLGGIWRLLAGLAVVFLYALFDLLWTYLRDKTWYLPVSSVISGFVLANVAIPDPPWQLILIFPFLAVAGKQLLHFGKMRHVFNPAGFSMLLVGFFAPAVAWWSMSWGTVPLIIVTLAGLFILWRQERWHVALSFWAAYLAGFSAVYFFTGGPAAGFVEFLVPKILDPTTVFFSTVMLIEPMTSMFPKKNQRVFYGLLVGFFAIIFPVFLFPLSLTLQYTDPFVLAMLFGNLICSLLFLPNLKK